MTKPKTIEEVVREFANKLAMQLNPSNDTMEAIRLIRKELPTLIKERDEAFIRKVEEVGEGMKMEVKDLPSLDLTKNDGQEQLWAICENNRRIGKNQAIQDFIKKLKAKE